MARRRPVRRDPEDRLSRRNPRLYRTPDGRERQDFLITYGAQKAVFVAIKHPATGEIRMRLTAPPTKKGRTP